MIPIEIIEVEGTAGVAAAPIPCAFVARCKPGTIKILAVTPHRATMYGAAIGSTGAVVIRYESNNSVKFTVAVCGEPKE